MNNKQRRFSGVFLLTRGLQVILQLRDKLGNIDNPGTISTFGGSAEPDEAPTKCALREIFEETGLALSEQELYHLGSTSKTEKGIMTDCDFYYVYDILLEHDAVKEGQPIVLSVSEALNDSRLTPTCRRMLRQLANTLPPTHQIQDPESTLGIAEVL